MIHLVKVLIVLMCSFAPALGGAQSLQSPTGPVVLTVRGDINAFNTEDSAEFDLRMLQNIGVAEIETSTVWTEGVNQFEGVELYDLMLFLGVQTGTILASAIDYYEVEIPVSDAIPNGPIVAYRMNGEEMSIRDKGPLWIMYPFDTRSEYATTEYFGRSIWQLIDLTVTQ